MSEKNKNNNSFEEINNNEVPDIIYFPSEEDIASEQTRNLDSISVSPEQAEPIAEDAIPEIPTADAVALGADADSDSTEEQIAPEALDEQHAYEVQGEELPQSPLADDYGDDFVIDDTSKDEADTTEIASHAQKKNKSSKGIIIAASVIAAVLIAGVLVFLFFQNEITSFFGGREASPDNAQNPTAVVTVPEPTMMPTISPTAPNPEIILGNGITVSGIDLSGKTVAQARELLQTKAKEMRTPISITVVANDKTAQFTQDTFKYDDNIEAILQRAVKDTEDKVKTATYELECMLNNNSIGTAVNTVADKIDVPMKNAYVSKFTPGVKNKFTFTEGNVGYIINRDTLQLEVSAMLSEKKYTGTINAKVTESKPTLTVAQLKTLIVPLSTHSTYSSNTIDGTYNMSKALGACNGSVIEPGATWSFNACTGNSTTTASGYRYATVISNGSYTQGVGGGICQASTTIFGAAVYANLSIAERYNHRWPSSYAKSGLDATIDYPALDLKLKNTTKYQIFLECYMDGNKLVANFYGWKDPSFDKIATYSTNYNISAGKNYSADAYRIYYKNDKEIKREFLCSSKYSLDDGHWVTASDPGTIGVLPGQTPVTPKPPATQPVVVTPTKPPATKPPVTNPPATTPPITQPPVTTIPPTEPPTTLPPVPGPSDETAQQE
ncbi:MAG: VanW family protein [Oscillospiraceae bacterium]|jgi:vancomycin resistance protein YoaR|nr:VanW family protein [Oscillospiraceae bacterium]